jgi:hypothetical protein
MAWTRPAYSCMEVRIGRLGARKSHDSDECVQVVFSKARYISKIFVTLSG